MQTPSDLPIVLTIVAGPDRGMVYSPWKPAITIGRLTTCDVPLNDLAVSRLQATIKREGASYWVYDENSRNGTDLGTPPKRVFHAELRHGDTLRVGETEIRVDIGTGQRSAVDVSEQTMLFGTVGNRTFRVSLPGLGGHERPV
ncbi:MAG: FHA domain-containing protein, partial [Candidatus Binatia bacterium]